FFIVTEFGHEPWAEILRRVGVEDDASILKMQHYDDSLSLAALNIGFEVLKVESNSTWELFGAVFVDFAMQCGFYKHLQSLGSNLFDLLTNINLFHQTIERDFRSSTACFPFFVVEGKSETAFQLTYRSIRIGLEPLLRGVLIKVTRDMFHADSWLC
ncbi:unnamed protein product, partial [Polarella glacialis]